MSFEIWSEGYAATGERAGAMFHGTAEGDTFQEACEQYSLMNPAFGKCFNINGPTYWGCRLFDNEADARKAFG